MPLSGKRKAKRRIVVIGAGGHARVVLALLKDMKRWQVVGILDRETPKKRELIEGHEIIGSWNDLGAVRRMGVSHAAIAVGSNAEREKLFHFLQKAGFTTPTLIHSTAFVDPSARIGEGSVICMGALVGANVTIGSNTIINSGAIVDHECRVDSNVHITPGCRVAGRVAIGANSFVGIGAGIIDKVKIGKRVTVGAGATVIRDLPDDVVAVGVPARIVKKVKRT